jgi:hypothetical protein
MMWVALSISSYLAIGLTLGPCVIFQIIVILSISEGLSLSYVGAVITGSLHVIHLLKLIRLLRLFKTIRLLTIFEKVGGTHHADPMNSLVTCLPLYMLNLLVCDVYVLCAV